MAAQIVSFETAIALARVTGEDAVLAALCTIYDEETAADGALKERLHALTV